jgi:hypothetical protein
VADQTPGSSADDPATLKGLLDPLGRDVAPGGLDVLVGEPVSYDSGEHSGISRAVFLAGSDDRDDMWMVDARRELRPADVDVTALSRPRSSPRPASSRAPL